MSPAGLSVRDRLAAWSSDNLSRPICVSGSAVRRASARPPFPCARCVSRRGVRCGSPTSSGAISGRDACVSEGGSASGSAEPPVREPTDACVRVGCRVTCEGGALEAIPSEGQAVAAQFHDSMNIHSTCRLCPSSLRVRPYRQPRPREASAE